jgi:uncharacterized protein
MKNFKPVESALIKHNLQYLRNLVFEVTDKCNLKCKYCGLSELYSGHDERKTGKMFSFEKAKLVIDYLFKLWKENYSQDCIYPVSIGFYGGEPLINFSLVKQIIEYLEHSEDVGKYFTYSMTTNAILLDKCMDYLAKKKIKLLISLDGDKAAQSYRIDHSGNNSFDRVFKNVKLLQEKYPEYFNKYVNFNSVLHNRNNVEPTFWFIKNNFGKAPRIAPLNTSNIREDKIDDFIQMFQNTTESINNATDCESIEAELFLDVPIIHSLFRYIYKNNNNVFINYNDLIVDTSDMDIIPTATCTPFARKMFVTVNGKILQCERISHDFVLGYVHDDYVELDYDYIAAQHNYYIFKCIKQCAHCAIKRECVQCIYYIDSIKNRNPCCLNFCSQEKLDEKNMRNFDYLGNHPYYYEKILKGVSML